MTSQLGYLPKEMKSLANGLQRTTDGSTLYASPAGIHLASSLADGSLTVSARAIAGGIVLLDAGGAPITTDLPTAAQLLAVMNGATVGSSIRFFIRNTGGETITLDPTGSGISQPAGNTLTIATANTGEYMYVFTNVDPGDEAAAFYVISSANVH